MSDMCMCSGAAGTSAKVEAGRLTALLGPDEAHLSSLVRVLGGRAAGEGIVSGCVKATCGAVTPRLQKCCHLIATACEVRQLSGRDVPLTVQALL